MIFCGRSPRKIIQLRKSYTYPTCDNLVRWLERELHPDRTGTIDRIWFYFSGHGVSQDGRDYLLATNTLREKLLRFALPLDEVIAALRLHTQADIVLVLDACREQIGSKSAGNKLGEQTQQLAQERGITTIFSCDYGQYSYELAELQHGAFTYALIEALQQHTLPIPLEQQIQRRVRELHQQANRQITQTPKIRLDSATKALHPLLPNCATAADVDLLVEQAKDAELEDELEKAKDLWWQVIRVSPVHIDKANKVIQRIDQKLLRRKPSPDLSPPPDLINLPTRPQTLVNLSPRPKIHKFDFRVVKVNPDGSSVHTVIIFSNHRSKLIASPENW
ncbi:MAG: hypothetical protein Fur0046_06810 [Cyanobacteria bacterium J069]|nr:MAG: hypothetical protein D6742_09935 [Cyanobacteria bacterium J069]